MCSAILENLNGGFFIPVSVIEINYMGGIEGGSSGDVFVSISTTTLKALVTLAKDHTSSHACFQ